MWIIVFLNTSRETIYLFTVTTVRQTYDKFVQENKPLRLLKEM